jgi:hypothetical protein
VSEQADRASADEQADAQRLDAAIDLLLADRALGPRAEDGSLDDTARALAASLPRLHPRFGFEERLAHRLRDEAGALRLSDQDRAWATVLAFPVGEDRGAAGRAGTDRPWRPGRRSLIGALASAASLAVTLAGAVFVVLWRRARGSDASEGIA